MTRFGIEEEFVFLDERSLVPVALSAEARARTLGEHAGGRITPEYLTCQVETATSPLTDMDEAVAQVGALRRHLAENAAADGAVSVATGTPFLAADEVTLVPSEHYVAVADVLGEITREHQVNGLHVHVEIADDEQRVHAMNRARAWMPALLAVTGNAPFSHGRLSGFASWRSILIRRLPVGWTPPRFHDLSDYRARVDRLIEGGLISDPGSLGWTVRLAERYPTVEVRVFDTQLTVEETVWAAALTRALLVSDDVPDAPDLGVDEIDASLWSAARTGPDARIVDPRTGALTPAAEVVDGMLAMLRPALTEHGDEARVAEGVARMRADGTGAQRQRGTLAEHGIAGLRELYRASTAQSRAEPISATTAPEVSARQ